METAKAVNGSIQEVDKFYMTEEQEDAKLLKAIVEGKKEGRMNAEEQKNFEQWLFAK